MSRDAWLKTGVSACGVVALIMSAAACHDTKVGPGKAASVSLDSVAAPSVVVGDTLRDTLGIARALRGTAYDDAGDPISGFPLKYRAIDAGLRIDSLTGIITGDSVRTVPIRVVVDAAGLQTQPVQLFVVPAPDTIASQQSATGDSLLYSKIDTTPVFSPTLVARVGHKSTTSTTPDPVQSYVVSFRIVYPTDTTLVKLVDESGRASTVDTTASDGTAGRIVRLRPVRLTQSSDSVIVLASARYRGLLVKGSPVRLVLRVKPSS